MAMWNSPTCSSWRARFSGPTSMACMPPASMSDATFCLAPTSSPAMNTSRIWPATSPATRVLAKVVLNALTTVLSGTSRAVSSAEEIPSGVTTRSMVDQSTGLAMSIRIFPARPSRYCPMAVAIASYGRASTTISPLAEWLVDAAEPRSLARAWASCGF